LENPHISELEIIEANFVKQLKIGEAICGVGCWLLDSFIIKKTCSLKKLAHYNAVFLVFIFTKKTFLNEV